MHGQLAKRGTQKRFTSLHSYIILVTNSTYLWCLQISILLVRRRFIGTYVKHRPQGRKCMMYPRLPGANDPPSRLNYGYGSSNASNNTPSYPPPVSPLGNQSQQQQQDNSPWGHETNSTLRVKIADDYKLAPPVQMPPALAASSRPQQEFDYEFERQVLASDASTSFDTFLGKPEDTYYENTKASRFIRAGFSPAAVNLALAYHAANRGDESQITTFCENFKTLTQDMSFSASLAAGALIKAKNDLSAAANLITELS